MIIQFKIVGVYSKEAPPVPIPNTEVKLFRVENTWLATTWKNKSMPALKKKNQSFKAGSFFVYFYSNKGLFLIW